MTLRLFGVTLLLAATAAAKEVVVLSTANFSETVGTKLWLLKFYAPVRSEAIHERAALPALCESLAFLPVN